MPKMLDLFCGTKSMAKAFERAGWETYTVDWEEKFEPTLCCDVNTLTIEKIIELCGGKPDFVHMSPDCFPEGTLVWTDKGYKDIKDIQCFDNVLTHTGKYQRVNSKYCKSDYQFYKIKISGCEEMLVTQNHPFLVRKSIELIHIKKEKLLHILSYYLQNGYLLKTLQMNIVLEFQLIIIQSFQNGMERFFHDQIIKSHRKQK